MAKKSESDQVFPRRVGRWLGSAICLAVAVLLARLGAGGVWATPGQDRVQQTGPPPRSIMGTVFEDLNRNGAQEWSAGEWGLQDVLVTLSSDISATRVFTTDFIGGYRFTDLAGGGTYTITETDLPGYFSTTPDVVTRTVPEPPAGGLIVDFGDHVLFEVILPVILRHSASW